MSCDFCSDRDPRIGYPVEEGKPWLACQQCAALIDAGELLPLCRRIITRTVPRLRDLDPTVLGGMMSELAAILQLLFWDQKDGRGVPLEDPRWDPVAHNWRPA